MKFTSPADLRSTHMALWLAVAGLVLILAGNAFNAKFLEVELDGVVANVGALLLITGVFQWLFEAFVRKQFAHELREDILGSKRVADSGISDFFPDSTDVVFDDVFLSSSNVTIGVNYSSKLVDNSLKLLSKRSAAGLKTTIIVVDPDSDAGRFLHTDFSNPNIRSSIEKIEEIVKEQNNGKDAVVEIIMVKTVLRYAFVQFDSRIWIVVATNGSGRRSVPGFFVKKGSPWFDHFADDVARLKDRV